jgi:tetratricopeptide (TPR) repeat protein
MIDQGKTRGCLRRYLVASCILASTLGAGSSAFAAEHAQTEAEELAALLRQDDLNTALITWDMALAEQYLARGDDQLAEDKMKTVRERVAAIEKAYAGFLEKHPKNAEAHNYFGNFLADAKHDERRAVGEWETAATLDPGLADAHNNLGTHYSHAGQVERGLDEYLKAIELDPNHPDYHFNLSQCLFLYRKESQEKLGLTLHGLFERVLLESRTARDLKPADFELAQDYAMVFFGGKPFGYSVDWAECRRAWEYCLDLELKPDQRLNVLLNLARVGVRQDDRAFAEARIEEALAIHPDSLSAKRLLEMVRTRK